MLSKESAGSNFDLPEEMLEVLPSDPFMWPGKSPQLRCRQVSPPLESEESVLLQRLIDRDAIIADLQSQLEFLDGKLSLAQQDKENLLRENVQLSSTAKKLNRDVAKLEAFRKTLMKSLQEDDDRSAGAPDIAGLHLPGNTEDDVTLPPTRTASMWSQFSVTGNSYTENPETEAMLPLRVSQSLLLASQTSTPRLAPPISPPSLSASVSPSRTPKPVSPRRHSISFSTARGLFDDRSSGFSSVASSQHSSFSGLDARSQSGRTQVDGKEFFGPVRNRLSYE